MLLFNLDIWRDNEVVDAPEEIVEKKVVAEEDGSQDGEKTEKSEQNGDAKENGVEKDEEEKKDSLENGDSKGKY